MPFFTMQLHPCISYIFVQLMRVQYMRINSLPVLAVAVSADGPWKCDDAVLEHPLVLTSLAKQLQQLLQHTEARPLFQCKQV